MVPFFRMQTRNVLTSFLRAGAPKARCQELQNGVTAHVHAHIRQMLFEQHVSVFNVLLTLQRQRASAQATDAELHVFINGVQPRGVENPDSTQEKPSWLSEEVWHFLCV